MKAEKQSLVLSKGELGTGNDKPNKRLFKTSDNLIKGIQNATQTICSKRQIVYICRVENDGETFVERF